MNPYELNLRANSGKPGEVNADRNSVWSWNQHNHTLMNMSYMPGSEFPKKLYRTWLGYHDAEKAGVFATETIPGLINNVPVEDASSPFLAPNVLTSSGEHGKIDYNVGLYNQHALSAFRLSIRSFAPMI